MPVGVSASGRYTQTRLINRVEAELIWTQGDATPIETSSIEV